MAHGEVYTSEFGWNGEFEGFVARIVADYAQNADRPGHGAWIAELDGRRAGCVFVVPDEEAGTARLRILLVHPEARGRDLGYRLVATALDFAGRAGYERMRLWTNHPLVAARRVYLRHGFRLVDEQPHRSFGVDLIGQTYERELTRSSDGAAPS